MDTFLHRVWGSLAPGRWGVRGSPWVEEVGSLFGHMLLPHCCGVGGHCPLWCLHAGLRGIWVAGRSGCRVRMLALCCRGFRHGWGRFFLCGVSFLCVVAFGTFTNILWLYIFGDFWSFFFFFAHLHFVRSFCRLTLQASVWCSNLCFARCLHNAHCHFWIVVYLVQITALCLNLSFCHLCWASCWCGDLWWTSYWYGDLSF